MQTLHDGHRIDKVASAQWANHVRVQVLEHDLLDHVGIRFGLLNKKHYWLERRLAPKMSAK